MSNLIRDKDDKVCAAKVAYWITLISCLVKMFIQDAPDYSGLALFIAPVAATYFGRNHTKANQNAKLN